MTMFWKPISSIGSCKSVTSIANDEVIFSIDVAPGSGRVVVVVGKTDRGGGIDDARIAATGWNSPELVSCCVAGWISDSKLLVIGPEGRNNGFLVDGSTGAIELRFDVGDRPAYCTGIGGLIAVGFQDESALQFRLFDQTGGCIFDLSDTDYLADPFAFDARRVFQQSTGAIGLVARSITLDWDVLSIDPVTGSLSNQMRWTIIDREFAPQYDIELMGIHESVLIFDGKRSIFHWNPTSGKWFEIASVSMGQWRALSSGAFARWSRRPGDDEYEILA